MPFIKEHTYYYIATKYANFSAFLLCAIPIPHLITFQLICPPQWTSLTPYPPPTPKNPSTTLPSASSSTPAFTSSKETPTKSATPSSSTTSANYTGTPNSSPPSTAATPSAPSVSPLSLPAACFLLIAARPQARRRMRMFLWCIISGRGSFCKIYSLPIPTQYSIFDTIQ